MESVADFTRARWNNLVRTLVWLGAEPSAAEDTALRAVASVQQRLPDEQREGDADVLVYGALLDTWDGRVDVARAGRVLVAGAGLSDYQAEHVLDTPLDLGPVLPLGADWDDLYRGVAPVAAIEARVARGRRRRRLLVAAGLTAAVVVGALLWLTGSRHDDPVPGPTPVVPVANPLPVPWWTEGVLHTGSQKIDVSSVTALAQVGGGTDYTTVYATSSGQVVQVSPDGARARIGRARRGAPIVGSPQGLAAWVDARGTSTTLMVWDVARQREAGRLALDDPSARAVAIDGDDVYVQGRAGALRWTPGDAHGEQVAGGLLDVAGGRALRTGAGVAASTSAAVGRTQRAVLSDDGSQAVVYDFRSRIARLYAGDSAPMALRLPIEDRVVDARFGPDGSVAIVAIRTYALSIGNPRQDVGLGGGRSFFTDLFTCAPDTGGCDRTAGRAAYAGLDPDPVVLAR